MPEAATAAAVVQLKIQELKDFKMNFHNLSMKIILLKVRQSILAMILL